VFVDLDGVPFPQAQVTGHTLHLLPNLAVVQVPGQFVRPVIDADDACRDVLWVAVRGTAGNGGRGVFG
jgi:hypothetical protein